jgi:hypothetical protein
MSQDAIDWDKILKDLPNYKIPEPELLEVDMNNLPWMKPYFVPEYEEPTCFPRLRKIYKKIKLWQEDRAHKREVEALFGSGRSYSSRGRRSNLPVYIGAGLSTRGGLFGYIGTRFRLF